MKMGGAGDGGARARRRWRVASVIGTRPEAIKMGPVLRELGRRSNLEQRVILTGQHSGLAAMLEPAGALEMVELRCGREQRSVPRLRERLHRLLARHFAHDPADLVLVHGDTASAFAGALAAWSFGIPIGHVEAGLRSFDLKQPWPEEGNRVAIDALSTLLFAPTPAAARNLAAEARVKGRILVTGNSGIDALLAARDRVRAEGVPLRPERLRTIVVTCHRKENQGSAIQPVCAALKRLVRRHPVRIVLPLHPNPEVSGPIAAALAGTRRIALIAPPDHEGMVALMDRCWLILSDSGGLQEEGPALGKPVLVLRDVTERAEALATENVELVGTATQSIVDAVSRLIADPARYRRMARPCLAFGDGRAAPRIAAAIDAWLAASARRISC